MTFFGDDFCIEKFSFIYRDRDKKEREIRKR